MPWHFSIQTTHFHSLLRLTQTLPQPLSEKKNKGITQASTVPSDSIQWQITIYRKLCKALKWSWWIRCRGTTKKRETTREGINLHGYTQRCSWAKKIKLTRFPKVLFDYLWFIFVFYFCCTLKMPAMTTLTCFAAYAVKNGEKLNINVFVMLMAR